MKSYKQVIRTDEYINVKTLSGHNTKFSCLISKLISFHNINTCFRKKVMQSGKLRLY